MVNFSEKMVRIVSLIVFVVLLMLAWKHHWILILEILPAMIFISTKGVAMFEDRLWWGTRLFWGVVVSSLLFFIMYKQMPEMTVVDKKWLLTRFVIALCLGIWFGDFFAKYIYIRLRFFINRIGARGFREAYKILSIQDYSQKYVKSPFKKMKVSFYYVTLEVNGRPITFLTSHEIFEQLQGEKAMEVTIKKGLLGYYYGTGFEKNVKTKKKRES